MKDYEMMDCGQFNGCLLGYIDIACKYAGDPRRDPDKLPRIIDPAGLIVIGLELIKELSGRNQESSRCRNAAIVCRFCYHLIIISFRTAQEPQKQP